MQMEKVKKRKVYEDIVDQFSRKIESGELKSGDKLPTERELTEVMGVSRTSIREALRAMELIGMVESRVGDGTYVKSLRLDRAFSNVVGAFHADMSFILDMFEVRMLLETYTIRMAAKSRTEEHLLALEDTLEKIKKDIERGDKVLVNDNRFHRIIAEAAGNRALLSILTLCAELFDSSIELANAQVNSYDIYYEHQKMLEAIKDQDAAFAARLMKSHLRRAYQRAKVIMNMK
ncbi:MAG: FadR/GntR family transcriptional regulator [Oscillospiraceae bacterium]